MRIGLAACVAFLLAMPASASNVRKEFAGIWTAREADYASADAAADKAERDTSAKFIETAKASGPTLIDDFKAAILAVHAHGEATARLKLLREFEAFMATKPSSAGAQGWMQGKVAELQQAVPVAAAEEGRLNKIKVGVEEPGTQWIGEKAKAASVSGMLAGLIAELTLIDENLRAYYQGIGVEQAHAAEDRARWAAALSAMGQSLSAASRAAPQPFNVLCTRRPGDELHRFALGQAFTPTSSAASRTPARIPPRSSPSSSTTGTCPSSSARNTP